MKTVKSNCPVCNKVLDAATGIGTDNKPKANDVSVCAYCATMLKFGEGLKLELLTISEFDTLSDSVKLGLNEAVYHIVNKHK